MDDWYVFRPRQWEALNRFAKLFLGPVSGARQRNLKFAADLSKRDSGNPIFWSHLNERLFPRFNVNLVTVPGFQGVSLISFAEFPREKLSERFGSRDEGYENVFLSKVRHRCQMSIPKKGDLVQLSDADSTH